jgi:hypothetical protein
MLGVQCILKNLCEQSQAACVEHVVGAGNAQGCTCCETPPYQGGFLDREFWAGGGGRWFSRVGWFSSNVGLAGRPLTNCIVARARAIASSVDIHKNNGSQGLHAEVVNQVVLTTSAGKLHAQFDSCRDDFSG